MDWPRFLQLARCPKLINAKFPCMGELELVQGELRCHTCSTSYKLHYSYHFPFFAARSDEELRADDFENPKLRYTELYTAVWAFGYYFLGRGEAESLFRTVNELTFTTSLPRDAALRILDLGCGIGRITCDMARYYLNALVVGIDMSARMLEQGYRILVGDPPRSLVQVSLENEGMGMGSAPSFGLENIFLAQGDALNLPLAATQFDLVISTNLVDRVPDPEKMVSEVARVLKPGGYFIMADPFNWRLPEWWNRVNTINQFNNLLTQYDFHLDQFFDGLAYKELLDTRGGHFDWRVGVVRAIKSP